MKIKQIPSTYPIKIKTGHVYHRANLEYLYEKGNWELLEMAEVCLCVKCGTRCLWEGQAKGMCWECAR